jgi:hypothetical protein
MSKKGSQNCDMRLQCVNDDPHYCQIPFSHPNNTVFVNKHCGEPVIGGNLEEKPSKPQELKEVYTVALDAVNLEEIKMFNSTTPNPWSEQLVDHNPLASMQLDSSVNSQELPSSAQNAMQPKQEEKMSNVGVKHDGEKPALAYIPKAALYAMGVAFNYGFKKYGGWNYRKGIAVTRTLSAATRHIFQFLSGEDFDKESGAHHLGSAMANIAMCLDTLERHPHFDDRDSGYKPDKK